jgi:hypothetical protein
MVNALLLIGVALIIGSFLFSQTPPNMQRKAIRIETDNRKRRH